MEHEMLEILGKTAGVGGIALGIFLMLFRQVLQKKIFPKLGKDASYRLLRLALVLTWIVTLTGILAWAFVTYQNKSERSPVDEISSGQSTPTYNSLRIGMPWPDGALGTYLRLRFQGGDADYELGWYQGNIRVAGYFVIHENIWMHQGMNIELKAISSSDVLLNFGPGGDKRKNSVVPRYTADVSDGETVALFQEFLYERLGRLVYINCEIRGDYAEVGYLES